jgi:glycosyltransferase involved in cell wall biosynthesis
MTDRPLVSIVTPTLNQGQFIEATIRSIKAQTYPRFEHIVIDGGSTDETLDILRRYDGTYPMRWLSEPDGGMYDAINKGMRLAGGDILAYLNSDDLYFPWTLETVVEAFETHPEAEVVFGDALGLSPTGRADIRFQPAYRYEFLLHASSFVQPAVFWRRAVANEVGPFDTSFRLAGDLDFFLRMGRARKFARIDDVLVVERDHVLNKRSQQWDVLMIESARSRMSTQPMSRGRRRVLRTVERFRAWVRRRALWLAFVREARRGPAGRRWRRFLAANAVRIDPVRFVLGQLPWLGRHVIGGVVRTGIDWGTPSGRGSALPRAADGDAPPANRERLA